MMTRLSSIRRVAGVSLAALLFVPRSATSQGAASGFAPGTRTIVDLNFAGTPIGDFPKGLRLLQGNMEVVDKDGMHMLRASSPSEFVLQLPEALPKNFTVEFEIIPKACCNPVDLMFEGVISGSRSSVSAQLEWHPGHFAVVGGNPQMFQMDMPAAIAATLPSTLTTVAVSFEDETVKMYTNGKRVYTLATRKFVRGRVLRISLGGTDDDQHAVYLARVRVADAGASAMAAAGAAPAAQPNTSPPPGQAPPAPPPNTAAGPPGAGVPRPLPTSPATSTPTITAPPAASAGAVPMGFSVTVTMGPSGPVVTWPLLPNATGYTVSRQKIDDVNCCNTSSGRTWGALSPWQDQPLPMTGTYVYTVFANTPAGQITAQTQVVFTLPTTPAGTVSTAPPPVSAAPVPVTGVPATTTATATAIPAPVTAVPASTTGAASPIPASTGGSAGSSNSGSGAAMGRYRVTITGIRAAKTTVEHPLSPDGQGDEVYVSAIAILWDRSAKTPSTRTSIRTKEYGDIGNGTFYPNRLLGGTLTPNGGISTARGVEQVPSAFDPSGSSFPAPSTDRFPLAVWDGTLTDGTDALMVVPALWESDMDAVFYRTWVNSWTNTSLSPWFSSTAIQSDVASPNLGFVISAPYPSMQLLIPITEMAANIRDHPIGAVPTPASLPTVALYADRVVLLTREKLANLPLGGATLIAIPYTEPPTLVSGGLYTLYLRVERIQ